MIGLAQKKLGGKVLLYSDANGSYTAQKAIEFGKMLEPMGLFGTKSLAPGKI